ncbi:DUF4391 domain-containing protein [Acinetobacter guillouiae]|uniref:DUF4391 domain-containing protein n=1 Tax=Acinetobacter guillouiae TaxID=106649 RepID=UPI00125FD9BB|nr:DUF4391 domain-containing protein [Acinetobacter guillouiae]
MSVLDHVLNQLKVPEKCKVDKTIFKKLFEQANDGHKNILDVKDRECLKKDIVKITWLYSFKPSTINIPAFKTEIREYLEVAVLLVEVADRKNIERINQFFNRCIPYPLVILFHFENEDVEYLSMGATHKRTNQSDKDKWVLEESIIAPWMNLVQLSEVEQNFFESMQISQLSFKSFYHFYDSIKGCLIALQCAGYSGSFDLSLQNDHHSTERRASALKNLIELEKRKLEISNKLKKEKQLGRQVELNVQLHKLKYEIQNIVSRI